MITEEQALVLGRKLSNRYVREEIPDLPKDLPGKTPVEQLYNYFHPGPHVCPVCGNPLDFKCFSKGYDLYCSRKCSWVNRPEKTRQTCMEKYGRPYPVDVEKAKQTNRKRYGADWKSQTTEAKEKVKQTCQERYGREYPVNIDKARITNLERYGVEYTSQIPGMVEKSKQTKLERYGDAGFTNREQAKKTCLERYGVEYTGQIPEAQKKKKETNRKRYGSGVWSQAMAMKAHPDILEVNGVEWICKCPHPDCNKCVERTYTITGQVYRDRLKTNTELCTRLQPVGSIHESYLEKFIQQYLQELGVEYVDNSRAIIPPRQLDIYIPSHHLAIECNGIFWHSDKCREKGYHMEKTAECRNKGIQLLHIWEDWVVRSPELVKNLIKTKLGLYDHRIGARQCEIKEISGNEYKEILQYHLQGPTPASVRYGLYYKGQLVSAMGFGRNRFGGGWELIRYIVLPGWQITGGAGRLFHHFITSHQPTEVTSFSSNDISSGHLYESLGFKRISETGSYWYVDGSYKRHHRYQFQKSILVEHGADPSKTEFEIMDELGYYRIWDSGQTKWVWRAQ